MCVRVRVRVCVCVDGVSLSYAALGGLYLKTVTWLISSLLINLVLIWVCLGLRMPPKVRQRLASSVLMLPIVLLFTLIT